MWGRTPTYTLIYTRIQQHTHPTCSVTPCSMVCQPKKIVHDRQDCGSLCCRFRVCRTTKCPSCDFKIPYLRETLHCYWISIFCTSGVAPGHKQPEWWWAEHTGGWYSRENTEERPLQSLSFFFPLSLKGQIWFLARIASRCQHTPCILVEAFHPTALQMSRVFTFCDFLICAGALQATLPERPPKERCVCTRCVPAGRVATEPAWPTPPPATPATAARVTVGATARWLWPCSMRTTTAWASAPCSPSASVWWLF